MIPITRPLMDEREADAARRVILSGWTTQGPEVAAFEQEFAAFVGARAAAALSSGTAGLHLALVLLGVGSGDEVLVPSLTFVASANAVVYAGARPVFLDSERGSWNVDPGLVEEELAARARAGREQPAALIGVDLYGQCADWDPILASCMAYGVPVIEDAAEALGATYRGRPAGSFGALNVFSFNGNKIITTSGGGMLTADDPTMIERVRHLSTQARAPAPHYEHAEIGFNYRMSNLLAAVGRAQLEGLPAKVRRRREINARYREAFAGVDGIGFMPDAGAGRPTNWLTVVTVADPTAVRLHLESLDIEARPAWKPMHLQPLFADCERRGGAVAEEIFRTGLCLPSGSVMTDADVDRVVAGVVQVVESA